MIKAAKKVSDTFLVNELVGNLKGKLAVDLVHPDRLVFSPDHDPVPIKDDGGLNWAEVTAICIDGVGDYH